MNRDGSSKEIERNNFLRKYHFQCLPSRQLDCRLVLLDETPRTVWCSPKVLHQANKLFNGDGFRNFEKPERLSAKSVKSENIGFSNDE